MAKASIKTLKKRRLKEYEESFKNIDADKMRIVKKAVEYAVDLEFHLVDLQSELEKTGFIEEYKNGANQFGTKESTASKSYSTVLKNYNSLIRTLLSCMPQAVPTEEDDGFNDFLNSIKKKNKDELHRDIPQPD